MANGVRYPGINLGMYKDRKRKIWKNAKNYEEPLQFFLIKAFTPIFRKVKIFKSKFVLGAVGGRDKGRGQFWRIKH
jgi:hypothetical protein